MLDKIKENPELQNLNVVVVGSGYVGLPLAVLRTLQGATVSVVDINEEKIRKLQNGKPPFYEKGLPELLTEAIDTKRISFHTSLADVVGNADVIYSCVGTPQKEDGSANLVALDDISKKIGQNIRDGQKILVIQTSTVPPGTTRKLYKNITSNISDNVKTYEVVVSDRPEFLQQGKAFKDNLEYDRKVTALFPDMDWARNLITHLEDTNPKAPFIFLTNLESAELVKYASNAFLANKISFANEIAEWADMVNADVNSVMEGVGLDRRVMDSFFGAGLGWAGGCFPKDTKAFEYEMNSSGGKSVLNSATIKRNKRQIELFVERIKNYFDGSLKNKAVAAAGVSFKPETDFVYPSQSVDVVEKLLEEGAKVKVYDPVALDNFKKLEIADHKNLKVVSSVEEMLKDADVYTLLTEWDVFVDFDLKKVKDLMKGNVIFDGRNALDSDIANEVGFEYFGIGRR